MAAARKPPSLDARVQARITDCVTTGGRMAGVDEVGRGPLAGPVVAAAVILDPTNPIDGLADSKLLTEDDRIRLDTEIRARALSYSVQLSSVDEIDDINILHASLLAMKRSVESLDVAPDLVLVDGNRCPSLNAPSCAVIKGDQLVACISAASIIAKVARDRMMVDLHQRHPGYGFDRHKGYPTPQHRAALQSLGVLPEHRRSYAPVRDALAAMTADHVQQTEVNLGTEPV